jgi:hypothetical protein
MVDLKESRAESLWQKVRLFGLSRRKFLALLSSGGVAAVLTAFPPSISCFLTDSVNQLAYGEGLR